ncbi:MAG TPA: glycosyltransferase [Conexivisphaerales archaeon]|nr:glycosyltransferase [Conexivisphaerales archaeon]
MRVAIIDDAGFGSGGTGLFGKELYSWLLAEVNERLLGNQVIRVDLGSSGPQRKFRSSNGKGVPLLRPFRDPETVKGMSSLVRREGAELLHANVVNARFPRSIVKVAKDTGVPLVTTVHSYNPVCPTGWATRLPELSPCGDLGLQAHCPICLLNRRSAGGSTARSLLDGFNQYDALRQLIRRSNSVVAPSKTLARSLSANIGSLTPHVLYNPLPSELLSSVPVPASENCAAFAGRLTPEKGAHLLPKLSEMLGGAKLHVMGRGPLSGFLEQQARTRPNLVYHGYVPEQEKRDIFRRAAVVVAPSLWFEAFGYSAAEALAMGRPVVGFGVGGIGELISESGGGIAVKPFVLGEFAAAVESILGDAGLSGELGIKARQFAERELSEEGFSGKLLKVYEEARSEGR